VSPPHSPYTLYIPSSTTQTKLPIIYIHKTKRSHFMPPTPQETPPKKKEKLTERKE
jgi:hypothetical protein